MDNQPNLTLKELNRMRGRIKAKLTNTTKFVDTYAPDIDVQKDIISIQQKIELMSEIKQELGHLFQNYLKIDQDDPSASECDTAMDDLEDQRDKLEVSLKCLLSKIECNNKTDINVKTNVDLTSKLPDIPLPIFSGKIEEFANFKNQFDSMITNNELLTNDQKLFYLKVALKGEVKFLETCADTFQSLYNELQQRYDNKRAVVDLHIQAVLKIDKMNSESSKGLRNITDTVKKSLRALKVLNLECNDLTNAILVNIILHKIDKETRKTYELSLTTREIPSLNELILFLENRSIVLDQLQKNIPNKFPKGVTIPPNKPKNLFVNSNKNVTKAPLKSCLLCDEKHKLFRCSKFLDMNVQQRNDFVTTHNLCVLCLNFHSGQCKSSYRCRDCNAPHNLLLHCSSEINSGKPISAASTGSNHLSTQESVLKDSRDTSKVSGGGVEFSLASCLQKGTSGILCTVQIMIESSSKEKIKVKAILDSGSSVNLMSNELATALGLKRERVSTFISGINGGEHLVKHKVISTISNEEGDFSRSLSFLVLQKITDLTPVSRIDVSQYKFPSGIKLADSTFFIPSKIHVLIGCELFFELLKAEKLKSQDGYLLLQNTVFGYLVTGTLRNSNTKLFSGLIAERDNLEISVKRFFEMESFPGDTQDNTKFAKTAEEQYCEEHFIKTHKRDKTGRYVVKLPIKEDERCNLGTSREMAGKRLELLWKKLNQNPDIAVMYKSFMDEYLQLNHMEQVVDSKLATSEYYIPHHAVFRTESTSTPLRVVFDASAKSSNGVSLNSILLNGGTVQQDIFSIATRFRTHHYAFSADITKMYRQVLVDASDRDLQKILWKSSVFAPVKIYRLRTVTYGTTCAPFLATRALKALAEDEQKDFPQASAVIFTDAYVDDILTGTKTLEEAKTLQSELIQLLNRGGMQLHKWVSNHSELLQDDAKSEYSFASQQSAVKTLGMFWRPQSDYLTFKVTVDLQNSFTKREVLSIIAHLYDPLGLINPIISKAKIFLQKLWVQKLDWSDPIPPKNLKEWLNFLRQLPAVNHLQVARCVLIPEAIVIELHGFSDASEQAYGAVIYIRSVNSQGLVQTSLLCSKSKVCPIKALTIPRLELSAALLLSRLMSRIVPILKLSIDHIYMWSDSTVTLAWIKTPPERLKPFVSNRVKQINLLCPDFDWRHVISDDNPADLISRGVSAKQLISNSLWWTGPPFLKEDIAAPSDMLLPLSEDFNSEFKADKTLVLVTNQNYSFIDTFLNISNDFSKLCRILSFICRFIHNVKNPSQRISGHLTVAELHKATNMLVKLVQATAFSEEIKNLVGKKDIKSSQVRNLYPFLDEEQILRVGGRLVNTSLTVDKKHPKLLPKNHKFTRILMDYFHKKNLHVGAQTLLHCVRQEFWPLGGRNLARKVVHECVVCFKNKPKSCEQLLGNLPAERVNPSPPFSNCGIDFCGPFLIKYKGQRKGTLQKVYVAIFVCFASKAIHLELVTDLTSNALIATLKRFFARRGKASCLYSDNAGNFISANSEIKKLHKLMSKPQENLANYLTSENINWKYIPPRTPSFGGLWESGVKSFKHHLKRAVGSYRLTFEEFLTVTTEIEGILNSRPISPMSSDPGDFEVLTPGHFLIGRPLNSIPEPDITQKPDNCLSRWQKTTKLVQIVWKKWNQDYLNHLQSRNKWQFKKDNVKVNAMVLLKNADLPPYKWRMGRIIETIKGSDGNVRVVVIKTSSGVLKRGITQICLLPIDDN